MKNKASVHSFVRAIKHASVSFVIGVALVFAGASAASATTLWQPFDSSTIIFGNSPWCGIGSNQASSYWRSITPSTFSMSGLFHPTSVTFGVDQSNPASATQPVTVRLYTNAGSAFPNGTLTLIGSTNDTVAAGSLFFKTVLVSAPVQNASTEIVVEISVPDGSITGDALSIGTNDGGDSARAYLSAPACGMNTPTPSDVFASPNTAYLIALSGNTPTSASATLGGRLVSPSGAAVSKAFVTITDQNGVTLSTRTKADGSFTFEDLAAGSAYLVNARARGMRFEPKLVQVLDNVTGLELTGSRR